MCTCNAAQITLCHDLLNVVSKKFFIIKLRFRDQNDKKSGFLIIFAPKCGFYDNKKNLPAASEETMTFAESAAIVTSAAPAQSSAYKFNNTLFMATCIT